MTVLRSRTFVVSPGTVAPVEAGGADVRDLSAAPLLPPDPPSTGELPHSGAALALERARQAYLRFESRVPVQLELG